MSRKNKKVTTYFILISLLLIGIIYAILQANLQINGIAKIKSNTWDIHFDNVQINENSVSIGTGDSAATIDSENNCKVDFSVTLSLPGDFYEFTVDVVNAGSIDAMIDSIGNSFKVDGVDSDIPDYLNYTVTYSNGAAITTKHKLASNTTETYKVRVEYKTNIEELPSASTLTMSVEIVYVQADDTATTVPFSLYNVFKTEAESNSGLVHEYTGSHKDSFTQTGTEKIYHWYSNNSSTTNDPNSEKIMNKWNVIFGGYCWQMYRTTDTGGVKLIYNGETTEVYSQVPISHNKYTVVTNTGNFIWNSDTSTWDATITENGNKEFSFMVPSGDDYVMIQTGTSGSTSGGTYTFYKDGTSVSSNGNGGGAAMNLTYSFGTLTSTNVIKMTYSGSASVESPIVFQIKMTKKSDLSSTGCDNSGSAQRIATSMYNSDESPAYVGYQYNAIYPYSSTRQTDWQYAPDVSYDETTGKYTLISKGSYSVGTKTNFNTTTLNNYHYSCGSSTDITCSSVLYIYYVQQNNSNTYYSSYLTLSNGEKIEDAVEKMFYATDVNQTDSTVKGVLDSWYQNNMTSYTSKLEDTIFCNDRSIINYSESGWNPDGGSTKVGLKFKNDNKNNTDLSCTNITDQFSMSNTKAHLTYPIGLMTLPESSLLKSMALVITGNYYWYMSPSSVSSIPFVCGITLTGYRSGSNPINNDDVRPVISLKPGTLAVSGDGSKANPYIVE